MKNIKKVVSLSGGYGAGKTYLANSLEKALPNCQSLAFSDTLRALCCFYYPEQASNIYADRKTKETRQLMRKVASMYQSRFGLRCFVDEAFTRVKSNTEILVISDARFSEEFEYLDKTFKSINQFVYLGKFTLSYHFDLLFANYDVKTFDEKPDLHQVIKELELKL